MDITESELSISLQEALTCYLAYLSHSRKLRESRLPRQGKDIETATDISTQINYQSRVAASETCLHYTGRIVRKIMRWRRDLEEPDDAANVEVDVENLRLFLEEVPEDPFADPFSGKWIEPTNASCAGPCLKHDEAVGNGLQDMVERKVQQRPRLKRQHSYRRTPNEYWDRNSKSRRNRPSLGLHPNVPITAFLISSETEHRSSSERSSDTSIEPILTPTSSITDRHSSVSRPSSDMVIKHAKPHPADARDRKYAEQLEAEEKRRIEQVKKSHAEARRLAERLAREETTWLEQQRRYAKQLEREEIEHAERTRRNREGAERAQARLEAEAKKRLEDQRRKERADAAAREIEAKKKSDDRRRREREENRKRTNLERENALEKEKRVRIGRELSLNPSVKKRVPSLSDEKRRRDAHSIEENNRKKREAENRDRASRPKKVDCVSCMEPGVKKEMAVLPCNHAYCGECITGAFKSAYKSRSPFKCCGKSVSTTNLSSRLSASFIQRYDLLLLELSTKKPTYCASSTCSKFIPPSSIHGPIATCQTCNTRTCVSCKQKEHSGVCKEDKEGKKVQELAKQKGWKQCPKCSQILERTEGCLHMTCRCRAEWCYSCLRDWDKCNSTCGRNGSPGEGAGTNNLRIGNRPGDLFPIDVVRANVDMLRWLMEEM